MKLYSTCRSKLNVKLSYILKDGSIIESVFYRRDTLCVSSQVGCAVGCIFCASGKGKFYRNLTYEEIVNQYKYAKEKFPSISKIAVAGIGEPLHNWSNVKEAFAYFRDQGLKVSFYTTGFPIEKLSELLDLNHNGVTVSLHITDSLKRESVMRYSGNIDILISFLRDKLSFMSKKKLKKISIGYLLMEGINDSKYDIDKLADLSRHLGIGVTLLYYNEVNGNIKPVSEEKYENIFLYLKSKGVRVTLSNRFRKDPIGGCGTLYAEKFYQVT